MKFGFVTCVELGLACMQEIYRIGGRLDVVITLHNNRAKSKSGRVFVDEFCVEHNIELVCVRHINDDKAVEAIHRHRLDWLFIIGWSQIAGKRVLNAPVRGCIGMHPTLLPQGRGRAAIPWAILKGLKQTGVTMFRLDEGVDTGAILSQEILLLDEDETATSLYARVADAHKSLMSRTWQDLIDDTVVLIDQDEDKATIWEGRKPEDGAVTTEMNCLMVDRLVRAVTHPYPGAFVDTQQGRFTLWAGEAHLAETSVTPSFVDDSGNLWLRLSDGLFKATDWEKVL